MREFFPLPSTFDQIVLGSDGGWRREPTPLPELGPRDLLFRLITAGLRPADVEPPPSGDRVPQGLPVGEIAAVGEKVTGWGPLDRALLLPTEAPGTASRAGLGEYVHVPEAAWSQSDTPIVFKLSEKIPGEDATLLPAAAAAVRLLRDAAVPRGGRLLVIGAGLVGQMVVLLARHQRIERILAVDPSATLRAKAEWSGATRLIRTPGESLVQTVAAETGGAGVHAAVALLPDAELLNEASRIVGGGGALLVAADFPAGFTLNVAPAWLRRSGIRIQGVRGFDAKDLRAAVRAVDQGTVNAETLVSRRIPWTELARSDLGPGYFSHGTHVVLEGPED